VKRKLINLSQPPQGFDELTTTRIQKRLKITI